MIAYNETLITTKEEGP